MKLIKSVIVSFAVIIIMLLATLFILLMDNSELKNYPLDPSGTSTDFIKEKVVEALGSAMEKSGEITITLSDENLNMLANLYIKDGLDAVKDKYHISDFVINTQENGLELNIKMMFADLIPTIIRVELLPIVKNHEIAFELSCR